MFIPKNHDKIQTISEIVSTEIETCEELGLPYDGDRVMFAIQQAVATCMPGLGNFANTTVAIEAMSGIGIEGSSTRKYDGLAVKGLFKAIRIEKAYETEQIDGIKFTISRGGLYAIVAPTYVEPDPLDLLSEDELLVPFDMVTKFEAA